MSSLSGGATFVGTSLKVSTAAIQNTDGGKAFDAAGAIVVVTAAPTFFNNGLPLDASCRLCIVDKAAAVAPLVSQNGVQLDANGQLVTVDVGLATAPTAASAGCTFDASGALVTSA